MKLSARILVEGMWQGPGQSSRTITTMTADVTWSNDELRKIAEVDDLHHGDGPDGVLRVRWLRRRPARGRAQRSRAVLLSRPPPWWPSPGPTISSKADQSGVEWQNRTWQSLRPGPAPRSGGAGLSCRGRAPYDQDAAAAVMRFVPPVETTRVAAPCRATQSPNAEHHVTTHSSRKSAP
jgi:hypothetical protein